MPKYYVGDNPKLRCEFRVDGTLTNPTAVTLKTYNPNGTTATYTTASIVNETTGIWSKTIVLDVEGTWRWKWEGTGAAAAARAGTIFVEDTPFE